MALTNTKIYRFSPHLITVVLFVCHLLIIANTSKKIQPINGDAQAYYAYLPSLLIYNDLNFEFIPEINEKYYTKQNQKSFLVQVPGTDKKVNKTFPGAALYYAPGFILGHFSAWVTGFPTDGYSTPYQVCFDIGYWFYLFLALLTLKKTLEKLEFSSEAVALTLIFIPLTTNIFFYTIFNQSVTHIFNFFTINFIVYLVLSLREAFSNKQFLFLVLSLAILAITRPTNILIIPFLFLFIDFKDFFMIIKNAIGKWKRSTISLLMGGVVLSIPFILWKAQSGNWIVYSYGDEGFNFASPEIFNFLFSYIKGWFTYTPIALIVVIIGFPILYKHYSKSKAIFAILFLFLSIYIFSSWWCWYYGAGQSQRVMIDYYLIIALMMAYILKFSSKMGVKISILILTLFTYVNVIQAFQIQKGILPNGSVTMEQYWDNFLSLQKKARIYPYDHWQVHHEKKFDFTPITGDVVKGNSYENNEGTFIQVSEFEQYSGNVFLGNQEFSRQNRLVFSFEAKAETPIKLTRAVIDFNNEHPPHIFGIEEYVIIDEWVKIEFKCEPFHEFKTNPFLYFWNGGSKEKVSFRNLIFTKYYTPEYM